MFDGDGTTFRQHLVAQVVKTIPPATVTVTSFLGIKWRDWEYLLMSIWIVLMIVDHCLKRYVRPWLAARVASREAAARAASVPPPEDHEADQ